MTEALSAYRWYLETRGPAGLDFLNSRVPHRFTGVYELTGGSMHHHYFFDKQAEVMPEFLRVVTFEYSFCQFVLREGVFVTDDSSRDSRLDGHKYKGMMTSYHGVPLLDNRGELFGTLCRFDVVSHGLPDDELDFLYAAARELPRHLPARSSAG